MVIDTPCGHHLDVSCLRLMFENATRDETLFPPKCCQQPIKLDDAWPFLDSSLIELYEKKSREFGTKDRIYCHIPACSAFLGAATASPTSIACTSPSCRAQTCGSCKLAAHPGRTCADHSDDVVLELGQEEGWQRCPSCKHLVELTVGCYHMTCRCQKEFCYLCARPWKTCPCPRFADVPDTAPPPGRPALVRHNAAVGGIHVVERDR
ncbi:hypothetical protein DICSQDRAFT_94985 [Dichomitus squalens LYAD-421 SS1]|uniref:RBR-type E3 ubiquitin transferase n=1 Tax=Dichomitus squalens TaxID=114155 RepID=A0A4Q9QCG2_9APHY|nr:uncharacterized protein DICSQDRAFT_94985 [Dichomitus squalens LYAD-421 SS1]EJF66522.1 hypothetical protein DICSQDRAFT_94985 [Dichomitus squalens LYAD-421 SS1]TBU64866.1 hypothetical protein BD310DRAFT_289983 [Dichomitus squalens]